MKFVLFPTLLKEEIFQGAPHLNILGISSKPQQMMRWVGVIIAAETYSAHGKFFCFVLKSV